MRKIWTIPIFRYRPCAVTHTLKAFCKHLSCPLASPKSCHPLTVEIKLTVTGKKTKQQNHTTEEEQISCSYHNRVGSNDHVRNLQVLLKQINAECWSNSRDNNTWRLRPGQLTKGILLATSRAFCLAVSTAYC